MTNYNISYIKDCFGCGVCAVACGKRIISIRLNDTGFYEPYILVPDQCTNCGLCLSVCSFHNEGISIQSKPLKSFAAWSTEAAVRRKCSSGGVGFELGRVLLDNGYKVCGVRYNSDKNIAEHYIATTVEELIQSIGSKYIQSYTKDGFCAINRKEKYLVTGTPCQIDSFRRYVRKFKVEDNFVLMDFFCHSVTSMLAWKKYIALVEQQVGKVTYVSWRNKTTGWHDSWVMGIDGEDKSGDKVDWQDSYNILIREKKTYLNSRLSQGDIFYSLFLGDYCCSSACSKQCKYKYDASAADIRIGDLWGAAYKNDEKGVSALVCFTPKGLAIAEKLKRFCELTQHSFDVVAQGQMKQNAGKAFMTPVVQCMLKSSLLWSTRMWRLVFIVERILRLPQRVWRRLKRILLRK